MAQPPLGVGYFINKTTSSLQLLSEFDVAICMQDVPDGAFPKFARFDRNPSGRSPRTQELFFLVGREERTKKKKTKT